MAPREQERGWIDEYNLSSLKQQVHMDNDASELYLGHLGTLGDIWGQFEDFWTSLEHLDCLLVLCDHFLPKSAH